MESTLDAKNVKISSTSGSSTSSVSHITYPAMASQLTGQSKEIDEMHIMEEKRLWLGNLDPKLTEFNLLKLVQKYGPIEQFDFLFHRSGPHIGLPRGYAFVEYEHRECAEKCIASLNGKRVIDRHIAIRWAHQAVKDYPDEQTKLKSKLPALGVKESESAGPKLSTDKAINAIEAKLLAMDREKGQLNFSIASGGKASAGSSNFANLGSRNPGHKFFNQIQTTTHQPNRYNSKPMDRDRNNKKPYSR